MLKIYSGIQKNFNVQYKTHVIDNVVFQMYHKITACILILFGVLLTTQELAGDRIMCLSDKIAEEHVINTFCFFTPTFTVVKYLDRKYTPGKEIAYYGIGATGLDSQEPIKKHSYYQWVPYVMIIQAAAFYLPHLFWKSKEGGRMKKLAAALERAPVASTKTIIVNNEPLPEVHKITEALEQIKTIYQKCVGINRYWSLYLLLSELLNLGNLLLQIYLTDLFLDGQFVTLGILLFKTDILDVVFPKVAKCIFHKYGPSGSIQTHDAMCILNLNVLNEKAYCILWFWYCILLVASTLLILWRIIGALLHSRSAIFNRFTFYSRCPGLRKEHITVLMNSTNYLDWVFVNYLSKNMHGGVFLKLLNKIRYSIDEKFVVNENSITAVLID